MLGSLRSQKKNQQPFLEETFFVDKIKHHLNTLNRASSNVRFLLYLKLNGTVGSDVDCYGKDFHPSGGCGQISGARRHLARGLVLFFGMIIRFLGFFLPWLK